MDKLKIIICSTSDAVFDRRIQRIATSLINANYDIIWYSRLSKTTYDLKAIEHRKINCFFKKGPMFYFEFNLRLFFNLLFASKGIICSVDLDTLLSCSYAARLKRSKLVFDSHELFSEVPELIGRPIVKKIWKWIGRLCIRRTDLRYTVGPQLAIRLEKDYGFPFEVVRNISKTDVESNISTIANKLDRSILYLGVLNKGRGLEEMISVMKDLPSHYKLILIGEGDLSSTLRKQVTKLEIEDRVLFLGMLRPNELWPYLQKGWCGVNLLDKRSDSYYYSLANKYFDYINAGLPSITIDFPEYKVLNNTSECSVLIPDMEKDSIKEAIAFLESDSNYLRLKSNCSGFTKIYNWENEESKLVDLYQKLQVD